MSNPRRARAITVAKVDDSAKLFRLRLLLLTLGATAALLALPTLF